MLSLFHLLSARHILEAACWEYIQSLLVCRQFKKSDVVLKKGQVCRYIYYLQHGYVRIFRELDGNAANRWIQGRGEIFISPSSFFGQEPSLDTIVVVQDCSALGITHDQLEDVCERYPSFLRIYNDILKAYHIRSDSERDKLLSLPREARYLQLLDSNPDWFANVPLEYIASYLGIPFSTFKRIRKSLTNGKQRLK